MTVSYLDTSAAFKLILPETESDALAHHVTHRRTLLSSALLTVELRCATDRIGHGTRLLEDAALEAYVIDHQIALEVCPTSNVQTRVVATFADHPLLRYHRLGAMVTINTDNRMMSGVTMSDEYARCVQHLGFSHTDLVRVTRAAFTAAFLPFADKQQLLAAADEVMTNLVAGVSADDNVFTVQPMSAQ